MDTLKAIALDWDRKTIDDAEARRRADALGKVVFHPDETVTGDGGWYEGDPDNLMTAVRAAIGTTKANEFASIPTSSRRRCGHWRKSAAATHARDWWPGSLPVGRMA